MEVKTFIDDFTDKDKVQTEGIPFWDYKTQKVVIGYFLRWEKDSYGDHCVLETQDDEVHIPNLMALKTKLPKDKIIIGSKIKIEYKGEVRSKSGRTYFDFEVSIK